MWTAWLRPMELCSNFLQKEQRMGKGISSCKSGVDLSPNYHPEVSKSRVDLSLVGSAKQRDGARSPRCSAAPRPVAFRERWLWRRRPARDCRARCAPSRLIDLSGETNSLERKKSSATIVADGTCFLHQIKRTKFSAHTGARTLTSQSLMNGKRSDFIIHQYRWGPAVKMRRTGKFLFSKRH